MRRPTPAPFIPRAADATLASGTEKVPVASDDPHGSSISRDATLVGEFVVLSELPGTGSEVLRRGAAPLAAPGRNCPLREALELRREVVVQIDA